MSGTLEPGTRIPVEQLEALDPYEQQLIDESRADHAEAIELFDKHLEKQRENSTYYRGLVEGGVLGIIMGSIVTACALALAWSHLGG